MISDYIIENGKCVICGEFSDGKTLCQQCYKSYKRFYDENENLSYCNKTLKYAIIKLFAYFDLLEKHKMEDNKTEFLIDLAIMLQPLVKKEELPFPDEETNTHKCLLCNEEINNEYLFCSNCYKIYKNKLLYLEIENCKTIKVLDDIYKSKVDCKDGHKVKSTFEKIIDDYFYDNNIKHAYERKIDINKDINLTPDFYLPYYENKKDIYIEYWGFGKENEDYNNIKEYKTNEYKKLLKNNPNLTFVYLYEKDISSNDWIKIIKYAEKGIINNLKNE